MVTLAFASLACGRGAPSQLSISLVGAPTLRQGSGSFFLPMTARSTLTIVLVATGMSAAEASFASADLPTFATLSGATLTLAPGAADVGSYPFTVTASAGGQTGSVSGTVEVSCATPGTCGASWARWVSAFGSAGDDQVGALAVAASGTVYAAGSLGSGAIFLRALASDGTVLLDRQWPAPDAVLVSGLAARPQGGAVLTLQMVCWTNTGCGAHAPDFGGGPGQGNVIAALDATGALVWQRDSGSLTSGSSGAFGARPSYYRLAAGSGGNVAATGVDATGPFVALLDPTGAELWRHAYGGGNGLGPSLLQDVAGNVTVRDAQPFASSLARYDASGAMAWQVTVSSQGPPAIAETGTGDVLAIAWDGAASGTVMRTYRGSDGALLSQVPLVDARSRPVHALDPLVAADDTRVAVLDCGTPLGLYDMAGRLLSATPLALGSCSETYLAAIALAPGSAPVIAGTFSTPLDFSTATTYPPRGRDVFVVDVAR